MQSLILINTSKAIALLNPAKATQPGVEWYIKASQMEGPGSGEIATAASEEIGGVKWVDLEYRYGVMHRYGAEDWMYEVHPDRRMVSVDWSALLPSEIEPRQGSNLPHDGAYYDPLDRRFYGFETVE